MTSPIESALQTILAADYGLNEGDHLKLCDLLKSTFEQSKKTGKIEKERVITSLHLKLVFDDSVCTTYTLVSHTRIDYVQNGTGVTPSGHISTHVPSRHIVRGICTRNKSPMMDIEFYDKTPANAIQKILEMHQTMKSIRICNEGVSTVVSYPKFIRDCLKSDLLEQKARKKYGPLLEDQEEHDGVWWRGDYGYRRFVLWIANEAMT
jgi:hypothetical protein